MTWGDGCGAAGDGRFMGNVDVAHASTSGLPSPESEGS